MRVAISESTELEIYKFEDHKWALEDKRNYGKKLSWETWASDAFAYKAV
jgi:hypothetical protein